MTKHAIQSLPGAQRKIRKLERQIELLQEDNQNRKKTTKD